MPDVKQIVRDYVVENFILGSASDGLRDDTSFLERGIIDSTGVLELVGFLEERFGISVEDDDLVPENLDSLNAIGAYLIRKGAGGVGNG